MIEGIAYFIAVQFFFVLYQRIADDKKDLNDFFLTGTSAFPNHFESVELVDLILELVGDIFKLFFPLIKNLPYFDDGLLDRFIFPAMEKLNNYLLILHTSHVLNYFCLFL